MRTPSRRLLSATIFTLAVLASFAYSRSTVASAKPGTAVDNAAGDPPLVDLAAYKDVVGRNRGKAVLATFWATWCQPCRTEYPMIVLLSKEYGPQGLVVVGVSLDEDSDMGLVRHFLAENHPDFGNFRQKPGIDADAFYQGVNPEWRGTLPENDFYARDGHLARSFVGEKQKDAFVQAIRLILAVPASENRLNPQPIAGN
jgi:thiol-disulfide isomerase/thioredoxin